MTAHAVLREVFPQSAAYRLTSSRAARVLLALVTCVVDAAAQAGSQSAFHPTRCVRDSLSALPVLETVSNSDSVAPGIRYQCIYAKEGPWALHVLTIDLKSRRYAIEGARARDAMFGREKVSDMVQRMNARGESVVVAINADFFSLRTGEIENNTVIRGAWVKGVVISDSPHDEFDNAHTQFAVDSAGRPLIGRFELHGEARVGARRERLLGINYRPPRAAGLVLYTPWFGRRTPTDSGVADSTPQGRPLTLPELREDSARRLSRAATRQAVEIALDRVSQGVYRARGGPVSGGGLDIPTGGVVLSATGNAIAFLRGIRRNSTVRIFMRLGDHPTPPHTVVGGWPRLIVDGKNVAGLADSLEGTVQRFSAARHPRSAIGISRDSSTLMLVVVDGRRPWSVGMSLVELADRMLALGAYQAMNLDGGGSSTLWVRGTIVNYPSDGTGERPVGNALVVRMRR